MTCRAKTYGNSFTEEGQKEKMEGSGTLSTPWDQEPLEWIHNHQILAESEISPFNSDLTPLFS
jgi:hypothetical protein